MLPYQEGQSTDLESSITTRCFSRVEVEDASWHGADQDRVLRELVPYLHNDAHPWALFAQGLNHHSDTLTFRNTCTTIFARVNSWTCLERHSSLPFFHLRAFSDTRHQLFGILDARAAHRQMWSEANFGTLGPPSEWETCSSPTHFKQYGICRSGTSLRVNDPAVWGTTQAWIARCTRNTLERNFSLLFHLASTWRWPVLQMIRSTDWGFTLNWATGDPWSAAIYWVFVAVSATRTFCYRSAMDAIVLPWARTSPGLTQ